MVLVPKFRLIDCRGSEIRGLYAVYHLGIMVVSFTEKQNGDASLHIAFDLNK